MSELAIRLLSTDAVIALIIGAFVTYIVKWLATKDGEKFKQYEGYAITLVKAAEKAFPDDSSDKGINRLNFVLQEFLKRYEKATGRKPDDKEAARIESWISEIHAAIEEAGII